MTLEVLRHKETSLVIDDVGRVIAQDGFLAQGYNRAIEAVSTYIKETQRLRSEIARIPGKRSEVNNMLYQSPDNIFAFSGRRGTGKTSSMLSFTEFLERPAAAGSYGEQLKKDKLPGLRVTALSPLDPTMLENDQDILSVVLSRLLYKAEERWEGTTGLYGNFRSSEEEKNQLLRTGNACMNGILAVKKKGEMKSLADLQRIGDSAVLKKNLYDFVNQVISFCCDEHARDAYTDYLVIPIDDTDCQIRKAYEVMEDIRRYLTLPNVIILMATDVALLRTVVAQHFADEFKTGISMSFRDAKEMEQFAEKYLTKLIPTSHRIYLPSFEAVIRENGERLAFGYYEDEQREIDLVTGTTSREREALKKAGIRDHLDFDFQSKVLSFIYQKTGIVFSEHTSYVNNIIPTTMRGLSHLMGLLAALPQIEKDPIPVDVTPRALVGIVERQLEATDNNLDIFKEYFMQEWAPTKLDGAMLRMLGEIERQVEENRIKYANAEIYFAYIANKSGINSAFNASLSENYYDMMTMFGAINGMISALDLPKEYKSLTDYYNLMAVRILLTIKNNKHALKIRKEAIRQLKKTWEAGNENASLIFDINSLGEEDAFPRIKEEEKASVGEKDSAGDKDSAGNEGYAFYLAPVISVFLDCLTDHPEVWEGYTQYAIYRVQEFAWLVICNWDVQDAAYKAVRRYFKSEPKAKWTEEDLMEHVCQAVCEKNCGMLKDYLPVQWPAPIRWPDRLKELLEREKSARGQEVTGGSTPGEDRRPGSGNEAGEGRRSEAGSGSEEDQRPGSGNEAGEGRRSEAGSGSEEDQHPGSGNEAGEEQRLASDSGSEEGRRTTPDGGAGEAQDVTSGSGAGADQSTAPVNGTGEDQKVRLREETAAVKALRTTVEALEAELNLDRGATRILAQLSELTAALQSRITELENERRSAVGLSREDREEIRKQLNFMKKRLGACGRLAEFIGTNVSHAPDPSEYILDGVNKGGIRKQVNLLKKELR